MFSVRPSKIHGRGCFANQLLRPATIFDAPSYEVKEETWTSVTFDGVVRELYSPFKYLNHSSDPNAELYWNPDREVLELYILRQIRRDEEVTISYGDDWE